MIKVERSHGASLFILAAWAALPASVGAQSSQFVAGPSESFGLAFAMDFPSLNPGTGYATDPLVTFPLTVLPARQGTIEFWARLSGVSAGTQASDITFVGSTFPPSNPSTSYMVGFHQNDGLGGGGLFAHVGTATDAYGSGIVEQATAPFYMAPFTYGSVLGDAEAWHHYALVWNDTGLPSGNKTALYLDGTLATVGYRLDKAPSILPDVAANADRQRFALLPFNRETQGAVAFDNLIIRDYAKLDFGDRFEETPTGPVLLWNRLGSLDQVLHSEVGSGGAVIPEPSTYPLAALVLSALFIAVRPPAKRKDRMAIRS